MANLRLLSAAQQAEDARSNRGHAGGLWNRVRPVRVIESAVSISKRNSNNRSFVVGRAIVPVSSDAWRASMVAAVIELGDIERTIGSNFGKVAVGLASGGDIGHRWRPGVARSECVFGDCPVVIVCKNAVVINAVAKG